MDYYFLDAVPWGHSQALYHAAARLGREALLVLRPATPYICIGFHQDAREEIDLRAAAGDGVPVFRREVGGGAVYLDGQQLFFQLVIRRGRPGIPANIAEFYEKFLRPVVETFRRFGVPAEYRPVNDIMSNGRKISGTGAAQLENMLVLVGNFIRDFDYERMSRYLNVPDEKFRDKVHKTMRENLTTLLKETGAMPANSDLAGELAARFAPLLGGLEPKPLDGELARKADEVLGAMDNPEWLLANDRRRPDSRRVKIAEGVHVVQRAVKAPGGLIRVSAVNREGRLGQVHVSGDFFFFPASGIVDLEKALEDVPAEAAAITRAVEAFYRRQGIESPGVMPADFGRALAD
jgi:lipoate-protein ligase A